MYHLVGEGGRLAPVLYPHTMVTYCVACRRSVCIHLRGQCCAGQPTNGRGAHAFPAPAKPEAPSRKLQARDAGAWRSASLTPNAPQSVGQQRVSTIIRASSRPHLSQPTSVSNHPVDSTNLLCFAAHHGVSAALWQLPPPQRKDAAAAG